MAATYRQENRLMAISSPLGDDVLLLASFNGDEGISRLFHFDLELLSTDDSIDFNSIVGQNVTVRLTLASGNDRYFNGFISGFSQGGRDATFVSYHAEIVPWLWFLTRTSDCRVFQDKKVPDIVTQIFGEYHFKDYKLQLYGDFIKREYCVQYRETDFAFISRLLEEEGIFYFFEHHNGVHTLVLANASGAHKPCPEQPKVRYELSAGGWQEDDVIMEWRTQKQVQPGVYSQADYNFELPNNAFKANVDGKSSPYEIYDYHPGEYRTVTEGEKLVRTRLEEVEAACLVTYGSSDCRAFSSGYRFGLTDHYRADMNQEWVITMLSHTASEPGDFRSSSGPVQSGFHYRNQFECIPYSTPFRPPRITPHPVVRGSQTAVVVGPKGEEIFVDKYGRVKVQFHWDREGKKDESSSCWIRVAQSWAGKKWGAMFIPRITQEVIVDFLEGDPDQPIITGSVYNAEQMPPYALPDEKTKSAIKSYSSKGGGGYNEIRFEDAKGKEQIFVHAERNQDIRIKKNLYETIIEESHAKTGKDSLTQIGGDAHLTVKGDQNEKVTGTVSLKAMEYQAKFGTNYAVDAGMEIHLKSGMNLVIESGVSLTLKVGGNFINLNPVGVFISGNMVMLNSGGAAGSGSGASPQPPNPPEEADDAVPGEKAEPSPPPSPPKPVVFSAAATVLKHAAASGAAFCEH